MHTKSWTLVLSTPSRENTPNVHFSYSTVSITSNKVKKQIVVVNRKRIDMRFKKNSSTLYSVHVATYQNILFFICIIHPCGSSKYKYKQTKHRKHRKLQFDDNKNNK